MHPPLLPSPSGDGLQFYRRRKPEKNPDDKEKATDIGTSAVWNFMHCFVFDTCDSIVLNSFSFSFYGNCGF
jgi:hypothetical protein